MGRLKILLLSAMFGSTLATNLMGQDWPNLKAFEADNAAIGPPKEGENRVVFMGNSITIGWLEARPDFFKGKPYINRGISGQTTPQMLVRFRQDVLDLSPKVVVLLAGTNDIAGNTGPSSLKMIMDNIRSMAELAKTNGIKVVLCSVLPVYDYPWKPGLEPAEKIIRLNKMIKEYALANDCQYLDYFSALVDDRNGLPKKYAEDGVHPNGEGYRVMEPLVTEAITTALE
ncbi:SGNH/GDSL hydrolase family protein [Maribacter sp. 2-571]|uniref:SGNH/GDSL hydrolase family protein n=1 Tax=Maribacter sp. 2-571 TaxID=3417569 RepID=UPI003D344443